jgi:HPt (histidine-containing phosphotransfer) domain-containing protein
MPGIDGVDTFVQLKEIFKEQGREVPVVCHTVEAARDNINLYKAAGFAEVLIKPIQPQRLSEVLMTYLPEGSVEDHRKRDDEEMKLKEELAKLPDWLSGVPGLDLSFGMGNCETAEDYMDALSVFAASVTEKADEIERLLEEDDLSHYVLKVHSLKSMARLVGALGLSETAAEMEAAGKAGNIELIREKTPKLLETYRAYADRLALLDEDREGGA